MNREEDGTLRAVVWAQDLAILYVDARIVIFSGCQQTRGPLGTVVSGDWEGIRSFTSLLVEVVMRHSKEIVLFGRITLEIPQKLNVSLASHDNLTMNVLDVHVFPAVCISPHQTRAFVRNCTANSRSLCCLLP